MITLAAFVRPVPIKTRFVSSVRADEATIDETATGIEVSWPKGKGWTKVLVPFAQVAYYIEE